jgi:hypothetical protein
VLTDRHDGDCAAFHIARAVEGGKDKLMIRQYHNLSTYHTADPAPHLTAWLTDWPEARGEIEKLLDTYLQRKPDYDRRRTEGVLEALDRALAELAYDAGWLEGKLT